jgi:hypothetical protein
LVKKPCENGHKLIKQETDTVTKANLKGDTVFLVNDKNCTDLNFSHFLMLGPQQWQLVNLANEKNLS